MSLWGNTDTLADAPKWLTEKITIDGSSGDVVNTTDDTITFAGHGFVTGDPVTYTSSAGIGGLSTGTVYYVIRVDADTIQLALNAVNANAGTEIVLTAATGAADDTLQKTPANLFFVDLEESQQPENRAKGLSSPGWWLYDTYTAGSGETRHRAIHVAELSTEPADAGDFGLTGAGDDATLVDRTITIDVQPVDSSETTGSATSFAVGASVDPTSALSFQWEVSTDGGSNWANATGGVYSGDTTSTLSISDNTGLDTYQYRVQVSATGATTVTSNAATLTEV